jgi:hypothetical protein
VCHPGPGVGLSTGRVGSGRVGLSITIARVESGLEVYAGKPGRVTGNPHF